MSWTEPPMEKHEWLALEQVARRLLGRQRRVTIGRYVVEEELGRGGFGAVYAANDPQLQRRVALKLVVPGGRRGDPRWEARLVREARALARVRHPNVVEVFDVGIDGDHGGTGGVYIVMELLRGESIRAWMLRSPAWEQVVEAFAAAGRGLAAAHEEGVVHRDLKPDNIMLAEGGVAKLIDFGLAREPGVDTSTDPSVPRWSSPGSHLTSAGTVMGTPLYMPPEQHGGRTAAVGPAADQYALCASLYHALYGKPPFEATTIEELAKRKAAGTIDLPSRSSPVPRSLLRVVLRALEPDPTRRWPSVAALVDRLEHELASKRPAGRRRKLVAIAAVIAAATLVTVAAAGPDEAEACVELARHRERVHTPERAETIRARLLSADASVGGDAWTRVEAELAGQQRRFAEQFEAACPAGDDAVLRCLDGWLSDADATLWVLEQADAARAEDLVRTIPDVADCSGSTAASSLRERAAFDGHAEQLREDLTRARALSLAGQLEAASELADASLLDARRRGDAAIVAYAALTAGVVWAEREELERARGLLIEAADAAAAEGLDVVAAEAATSLVRVLGATGAFEDSRRWAHVAEARIAGLGHPMFMRRWLLNARSFASIYEGDYETAYQLALELVEICPADEMPLVRARALANVALTAFEIGRTHEARAVSSEAIALLEGELGPSHPSVGRILADAGRYACAAGDVADGVAMIERAVAMMEAANGPDDPYALNARRTLANYLSRLGRSADALAMLESVYTATKRLYGGGHVRTAATAFGLADEYLIAERPDDALPLIREGTDALTALYGAGSPRVADAALLMARALQQKGELDEARDVATRQLANLGVDDHAPQGLVDDPSERETTINLTLLLATLDHEQGRFDDAIRTLERGIALCKADASSNDPSVLASFESARAFAEADRGRPDRAVAAAREAIAHLQRIGATEELAELQALVDRGGTPP